MNNKRKKYIVLKDCEISFPIGIEKAVYQYYKGAIIYLLPTKKRTLQLITDGLIQEVI